MSLAVVVFPRENKTGYPLPTGQRVAIQIESSTGTTPMIKGNSPNIKTEFEYEAATHFYAIFGYENVIEVLITGDVKLATIYFPNPATGKPDSLVNVELPQVLKYSQLPDGDIVVESSKQKVAGSLKVEVRVKGIQVETRTTTAPYGVITSTINAKSRKSTSKTYDPKEWPCGTYNGRRLITGPKGGCYYINSNGNKTYVDRNYCHGD